jgi:hypothetical protein
MSKAISVTSRKAVLYKTPPSPGRLTFGVLIKRLMRQWERQNLGCQAE